MARLRGLTPEQRAEALRRLGASGGRSLPSGPTPTPAPPVRPSDPDPESPAEAFAEKGDYLSELRSMEAMVRADVARLEGERGSATVTPAPELLEALEESKVLLIKLKRLQRREIEKRAEEFSESGQSSVEPFGYELFAGAPTTFAPGNEVPVPPDYAIGPGDVVEVQLFGQENAEYSLSINREGLIRFPNVGPINVFEKGTDFLSLKNLLKEKITEHLGEGVQSSISMGALRSIRVFMLGDVRRPGAYVVSSLSTMTNALLVSGGIKGIGSLRDVQLKRQGEVVARLDLYDMLLRGDTTGDARLQPADVIFIPPVGGRVTISGSVLRPATYELADEGTVGEVVLMAGSLSPRGFGKMVRVERVGPDGLLRVRNIDITTPEGSSFPILPGDMVSVPSVLERADNVVSLLGHVERPGDYEWREGLTIREILPDVKAFRTKVDVGYGLVRREDPLDGSVSILSFSPREILEDGSKSADEVVLRPRDVIMIFDRADPASRRALLEPVLEELRQQNAPGRGGSLVSVTGMVHFPGTYPLASGMRMLDLLTAGGGLREAAYASGAELTRYRIIEGHEAEVGHVTIGSFAELEEDEEKNLLLQPYDVLNVKPVPAWAERETVEIMGEVLFPGSFSILPGERLADVVRRAGGLTKRGFAEGAVFTRMNLKEKEDRQRERLVVQLEADLAMLSLREESDAADAGGMARSLLARLRSTRSIGRLIIDLPSQLNETSDHELWVRNGDRLFIPRTPYEVSVVGEVQHSGSHIHKKGLSMDDYVSRSGGYAPSADKKRTFVVRADGAVATSVSSGWFSGEGRSGVRPGDVIVVPLDPEHGKLLERFAHVSQIIYQVAIAAAAVNSF